MSSVKYIIFITYCLNVKVVLSTYCFWNSGCPYKYFGSKTPYNSVRGDLRDSIIKLQGELKYIQNLFLFNIFVYLKGT